jgi:hypothetical protein
VSAETLDMFPDLPHPEPVPPPEQLSADRRRTIRQRNAIEAGRHPLSALLDGLKLHPDAIRSTDPARTKAGPRCGDCLHRFAGGYRTYPKCVRMDSLITRGPASDCRAWWPGCTEWKAAP